MSRTFSFTAILVFTLLLCIGCAQSPPSNPEETPTSAADSLDPTAIEIQDPTEIPAATTPPTTWIKNFRSNGGDVINDILMANDGGFFLLANTNMSWDAGMQSDLWLIRIDQYGERLWDHVYPFTSNTIGQSMIFTEDENILIAGARLAEQENTTEIFLLSVDQEGNELNSKTIEGSMDEWIHTIEQTDDGGILLIGNSVDPNDFVTDPGAAGYGGFENRSSILLKKLDPSWEEEWTQVVDNGENVMSVGGVVYDDGSIFILSSILNFPEPGDTMQLAKFDKNGNSLWTRTWEDGGTNARALSISSDGNMLIGAIYSPSGDSRDGDADILITEIDPENNEVWSKIFGVPGEVDMVCELIELSSGGLLLAVDRSANLYRSDSQFILILLDNEKQVVWENTLNEQPHFMISGLLEVEDGFLAGTSFFPRNSEGSDIMLIKTDADGRVTDQ